MSEGTNGNSPVPEPKGPEAKDPRKLRIVIEMDAQTGELDISGDLGNEVLVTGIMVLADRRIEEHFANLRYRALQEAVKKGIIKPTTSLEVH